MLHFIDHVLVPYIHTTRGMLGFVSSQCALALFDVFVSHHCASVLQALERNNIKYCFIPANCTGELRPLDHTVIQVFKQELKARFIKWYAGLVTEQLDDGVELGAIKPDLRISALKPFRAHWLMEATFKIPSDVIVDGVEKGRHQGVCSLLVLSTAPLVWVWFCTILTFCNHCCYKIAGMSNCW